MVLSASASFSHTGWCNMHYAMSLWAICVRRCSLPTGHSCVWYWLLTSSFVTYQGNVRCISSTFSWRGPTLDRSAKSRSMSALAYEESNLKQFPSNWGSEIQTVCLGRWMVSPWNTTYQVDLDQSSMVTRVKAALTTQLERVCGM